MKTMVKLKRLCSGCGVAAALVVCLALGSGAAEGDNWGAIAYAFDTGADGYSYGFSTADAAKQRALDECRQRGSDCMLVVWFRNECAAISVGFHDAEPRAGKLPDGQGLGMDKRRDVAESEALDSCRKTTKNCFLVRSVCATQ